jgi:hypothetical protein
MWHRQFRSSRIDAAGVRKAWSHGTLTPVKRVADRVLLVLGMHRSGTSALTRVLNLRGAALPGELLPANQANVAGYWEPAAVVAWHDEFLAAAGSAWDDPTAFPAAAFETPAAETFVERVADLLRHDLASAPLVVMKDPRACRLVPLWRRAIARAGREPLMVLIVRHPLEVAASLQRRDGIPVAQALLLWLEHVLAAEASTRGDRRAVVTYDQLLGDWSSTIARIERNIDLALPATGADADAQVDAFLSADLRHERVARAAIDDEDVSDWVRRVYRWHERASQDAGAVDSAELDEVRRELCQAATLYAPVIRVQRETLARQAAEQQDLREQMERDRRQWATREQGLQMTIAQLQTQASTLGERLSAIEARLEAREQASAALQIYLDRITSTRTWRLRGWCLRQMSKITGRAY